MTAILTLAYANAAAASSTSAIVREMLAADRAYYVRSDGSDSNTGLADTAGGAKLTMQAAYDVISGLDFNGKTVTLQHNNVTFTDALSTEKMWIGGGALTIDGGGGTWSVTSTSLLTNYGNIIGTINLQNVTLQTTTSGNCIDHQGSGLISLGSGIVFGACAGYHMISQGVCSSIYNYANYTISGDANAHIIVTGTGNRIVGGFTTITITGARTFSLAFAYATAAGVLDQQSFTYTIVVSVTGVKYQVLGGADIIVGGAGINYFPGSSPGTGGTTTGGGFYA